MQYENITATNISFTAYDNSSESYTFEKYLEVYDYLNVFEIILSISVISYGLLSWGLLPKWRTFKNYVLLNTTVAVFFKHFLEQSIDYLDDDFQHFTLYFHFYLVFKFAYSFWLLIMSAMFYSSIVKIFKPPKEGRYLKSALISWGIPGCLSIFDFVLSEPNMVYDMFWLFNSVIYDVIPNAIQLSVFVMYMMVIWHLFKGSAVRRSSGDICAKVQLATLLLLMSGIATITCHIVDALKRNKTTFTLIMENVDLIPNVVVCVWILATKSNRCLWMEYYRNRIRQGNVNTVLEIL